MVDLLVIYPRAYTRSPIVSSSPAAPRLTDICVPKGLTMTNSPQPRKRRWFRDDWLTAGMAGSPSSETNQPSGDPSAPQPTNRGTSPGNPFARSGYVKTAVLALSIDQAMAAASEAGYRVTSRSRATSAHVQRDWRTAATIRPVPGVVTVKGPWTTQLVVATLVVLVLLFGAVSGIPFAALLAV